MNRDQPDAMSPQFRAQLAVMCRNKLKLLLPHFRKRARQLGYAIAVHGSIARDIDLVAVPWSDDAVSAEVLAWALVRVTARVNGVCAWCYPGVPPKCVADMRIRVLNKPHGRKAWLWHLGGGPMIDLSVMPLAVAR